MCLEYVCVCVSTPRPVSCYSLQLYPGQCIHVHMHMCVCVCMSVCQGCTCKSNLEQPLFCPLHPPRVTLWPPQPCGNLAQPPSLQLLSAPHPSVSQNSEWSNYQENLIKRFFGAKPASVLRAGRLLPLPSLGCLYVLTGLGRKRW